MKKRMSGWFAMVLAFASAGSLVAHHSLSQFETTTAVWAKGPIARIELINPHSIIFWIKKVRMGRFNIGPWKGLESLNSRGWASVRKP